MFVKIDILLDARLLERFKNNLALLLQAQKLESPISNTTLEAPVKPMKSSNLNFYHTPLLSSLNNESRCRVIKVSNQEMNGADRSIPLIALVIANKERENLSKELL